MPDLNELLAWATANTPAPANANANAETTSTSGSTDGQLQLRFNPNSTSSGSSALHPSDAGLPAHNDLAPSTPANADPTRAKREDLTSEMLDLILGKSDSIVMKEKMACATDENESIDNRVQALDDFEMLIEMMDNANNMAILKLWQPLLGLLKSDQQPVVAHACWIIGTAVQNNLKAQAAAFIFNALPEILNTIYPSDSSSTKSYTSTRAKATYALSSTLKHWPLASSALASNSSQGYSALSRGVRDPEPVIRRKMAFLVGTLTMQSGEKYEGEIPGEVRDLVEAHAKSGAVEVDLVAGLKKEGVFAAMLDGLKEEGGDVEYEENVVRALAKAAEKGGLSGEQKEEVKGIWTKWGKEGQEERALEGEDAVKISKIFS